MEEEEKENMKEVYAVLTPALLPPSSFSPTQPTNHPTYFPHSIPKYIDSSNSYSLLYLCRKHTYEHHLQTSSQGTSKWFAQWPARNSTEIPVKNHNIQHYHQPSFNVRVYMLAWVGQSSLINWGRFSAVGCPSWIQPSPISKQVIFLQEPNKFSKHIFKWDCLHGSVTITSCQDKQWQQQ